MLEEMIEDNKIKVRLFAAVNVVTLFESILDSNKIYLNSTDRKEKHISPLRLRELAELLPRLCTNDKLKALGLTESEIKEISDYDEYNKGCCEAGIYGEDYDNLLTDVTDELADIIKEAQNNPTVELDVDYL